MEPIYLDHAATTPLDPEVRTAMEPYLTEAFGNPSSSHRWGRAARAAVDEARERVAQVLGADPREIVFTAGGTEADNLALRGVAWAARRAGRGRHLIVSAVEHHAVLHTAEELAADGFEVTVLPVDEEGFVDPDRVLEALRTDTVLVSLIYANNEIGTIQPIAEIGRVLRARGIPFHTDAVQAAGHLPLRVDELGVDLLSLSGHKFYGPKGVGVLYVRHGTPILPQITGGGQERGLRSGTENVAGIVGLAAALEKAERLRESEARRLRPLRDRLLEEIPRRIPGTRITGPWGGDRRLPHHASFVFDGVAGDSLVLLLDREGIAASSGSACSAGVLEPSHVVLALGVPPEQAVGSLRLTLGRGTTPEQIDRVLEVLPRAVARIRELAEV